MLDIIAHQLVLWLYATFQQSWGQYYTTSSRTWQTIARVLSLVNVNTVVLYTALLYGLLYPVVYSTGFVANRDVSMEYYTGMWTKRSSQSQVERALATPNISLETCGITICKWKYNNYVKSLKIAKYAKVRVYSISIYFLFIMRYRSPANWFGDIFHISTIFWTVLWVSFTKVVEAYCWRVKSTQRQ